MSITLLSQEGKENPPLKRRLTAYRNRLTNSKDIIVFDSIQVNISIRIVTATLYTKKHGCFCVCSYFKIPPLMKFFSIFNLSEGRIAHRG